MASGEFDLIARLVERLPPPGPRVRVGSGDDAAVTESAQAATATTVDAIVEGVHFTLPEFPLPAVGRKALAGALSDLAAMGAEPGEAYIALGAPEGLTEEDLLAVGDGLAEVAEREGVSVAGGDVTRAPVLSLAVTCVGHERPGIALVTRGGAQPGDAVAVTGELGGAAAALSLLADASGAPKKLGDETRRRLLARQLDPRPRLAAGLALAAGGANAMIDISDGLGADAGHLARASGVALVVELGHLPLAEGAAEVAGSEERARELAVAGGEDFELLVCLPPEGLENATKAVADAGYPLTRIGEATEGEPGTVSDTDGRRLESEGFDHMRGSRAGSG
jgi:thiamine-monophosphate kinase